MMPAIVPQAGAEMLAGAVNYIEQDCISLEAGGPGDLPVDFAQRYGHAKGLYTMPLYGPWILACNTLLGGAPLVLGPTLTRRLADFRTPRQLEGHLDCELARTGLITPPDAQLPPPARPATLAAWLHVTDACNLECPYCYVRKSGAHMDLKTGQQAIDALLHTASLHGFPTLQLKYAGGEAALHYRMVQQLHAYAVEQAARAGITLQSVVLSNGTVMPHPFASWLAASGVRLMLSVDGRGADNDQQRPYKGGAGGGFAALERNLNERLLPRGIRPDVCITVTGSGAARVGSAVEWALDHGLPFSLNLYREHDLSASFHQLRYEEQTIIAELQAVYAAIERRLPQSPFLNGLLDRVQAQAHSHACGLGHSYVVITHEGRVAPC
ncbi:MAG: hypothetical protein HGA45_12235, partial [Chloroflexales bacterium]|nr:hypothetical protein [Chloroflexales bacterium]